MQNKAAGAFTYMETILFIGGPKHGSLEQVQEIYSHQFYAAVQSNNILWNDPDPISLGYTQVAYDHEGYWNSPYGHIHIFIEHGKKYILSKLTNYAVKALLELDKELVFVLDHSWNTDESICLVREEAFKAFYKTAPGEAAKMSLFVQQAHILVKPGEIDPAPPKQSNITIEYLNEILKKMYMPNLETQLMFEYKGLEAFKKAAQGELESHAWLNAGIRDTLRHNLCYGCCEELIGPGFGEVNDLIVPKGKGRRVRKLVCGNCGRGKFNRFGQRIGDWDAVA